MPQSTKKTQVGGSHYTKYPIQPLEFCYENKLDPYQTKVIKYTMRHADKGGAEDLDKAIDILRKYKERVYKK